MKRYRGGVAALLRTGRQSEVHAVVTRMKEAMHAGEYGAATRTNGVGLATYPQDGLTRADLIARAQKSQVRRRTA